MKIIKMLPDTIGTLHFVGIGGIGMSGIAEILLEMGYNIQGSDIAESYNVARLREKGAKIFIGQDAANIQGANVVVISTAIKETNPEYAAALIEGVPVVHRSEMLAEIMRFQHSIAIGGTHGKTTTTSMVYSLLEGGNIQPTVINGGILNSISSNARIGGGEWMVVEADESDGSFTRLRPTVAVITNMDPEHMEHYGSMDAMRDAFHHFAQTIPFFGSVVLGIDHPEVQRLRARIKNRRVITYGLSQQADYRAENIEGNGLTTTFDMVVQYPEGQKRFENITLNMPGIHNVQNALAAIAVADELEIELEDVRKALAAFEGVKRRFTVVGKPQGITVVDDYGHHPAEIEGTLTTARKVFGGAKVTAVIQPHRYSRLKELMGDFARCAMDADAVVVTPVYAAGEDAIDNVSHIALAERMRASGHRDVATVDTEEQLAQLIKDTCHQGDAVVCLGAGDITKWAANLVTALA